MSFSLFRLRRQTAAHPAVSELSWEERVELTPRPLPRVLPTDFPRGFAETRRDGEPFALFNFELAYGEIFDAGIQWYGEFFVDLEYGWDLLQHGLKIDGNKCQVSVASRFENAVQLKVRHKESL